MLFINNSDETQKLKVDGIVRVIAPHTTIRLTGRTLELYREDPVEDKTDEEETTSGDNKEEPAADDKENESD